LITYPWEKLKIYLAICPIKCFQFLKRDVSSYSTFEDIDKDIDCVVHLAAFKIPRYGKAIDTLKINFHGTENVLEFARKMNCKCVLSSTSDVYGKNLKLPFKEDDDSVFGSSKVRAGVMQFLSYSTSTWLSHTRMLMGYL